MNFSPSDFRAAIARQRLPLYQLAAAVGVNPNRLGGMLNEKIPLNDSIAGRLVKKLKMEVENNKP